MTGDGEPERGRTASVSPDAESPSPAPRSEDRRAGSGDGAQADRAEAAIDGLEAGPAQDAGDVPEGAGDPLRPEAPEGTGDSLRAGPDVFAGAPEADSPRQAPRDAAEAGPAPVPRRRHSPLTISALAAIIALGALLRLVGIGWSLPDARHPLATYHPDELVNLAAAQTADIPHGRFDIGFYNYGAFYFYLASLADTIGHGYGWIPSSAAAEPRGRPVVEVDRIRTRERADEFLAGRLVTAAMGIVTIPVIFAAGFLLYGRGAGLVGALFYAVAPLPVVHAHFFTVDVPATLFVSLVLLSAARMLEQDTLRNAIVAGIWCGLAAATKYTAIVAIVAPLAALRIGLPRGVGRAAAARRAAMHAGALAAVAAVMFLVACPGPWLNWHVFWDGTYSGSGVRYELFEHPGLGQGTLFTDTGPAWLYHLTVSLRYGLGLPLLTVAIGGCAYAAWRRTPADLVLLTFLVIGYASMCFSAVRFARYTIPLVPALCLLAGRLAVAGADRRARSQRDTRDELRQRCLAGAAAALFAAACALPSAGLVAAMAGPDPRDQAAAYILGAPQAHTVIGFAHIPWFYSPPLSPQWGALPWQVRAHAPPVSHRLEFRIADGDWDRSVLDPPTDLVALSNIEEQAELRRLRLPAAVAFMAAIPAGTERTVFAPPPVATLSPDDPNIPQDLLYVLPKITLYRLRGRTR